VRPRGSGRSFGLRDVLVEAPIGRFVSCESALADVGRFAHVGHQLPRAGEVGGAALSGPAGKSARYLTTVKLAEADALSVLLLTVNVSW
jgi:hypothetical protein